jgi:DNA-directed RNA polymerase I subunit RPA2
MKSKVDIRNIPSYSNTFVDENTHLRLKHSVAPHVDSFNYFLEHGLNESVLDIPPMEIELDTDLCIRIQYKSAEISYPSNKDNVLSGKSTPREKRESGSSYTGTMVSHLHVEVNNSPEIISLAVKMGEMPVMVMSNRCHLKNCNFKQLVELKEEANEVGGYFVMNGIERVIRLLQVPCRNYASAIERSSYKNRGPAYSDKGVAMRCVRRDQSSVTMTLHYLNSGGATLKFVLRKQEFLLPVVMVIKALVTISDAEIFERIVQGDKTNTFLTTRLELLLRDFKSYNLFTKSQCQSYLGGLFRNFLPLTSLSTDEEAGSMLIKRYLFVHTDLFTDKLECLLHMTRKLFSFAEGKCSADNADALMNHEILLPGHLITMYVKEKMEEVLTNVKQGIIRDYRLSRTKCLADLRYPKFYQKHFDRFGGNIGGKIGTFLSTGNIVSSTGLDLMQVSGYTIVAERLNLFRYMSHFQAVHRGQFFTTMKTTTVRKLLPESWGFLCPVHTPDGSPCGLLNHLSKEAAIISYPTHSHACTTSTGEVSNPFGVDLELINSRAYVSEILCSFGMISSGVGNGDGQVILRPNFVSVMLDGVVLGGVEERFCGNFVSQLRVMKVNSVVIPTEGKDCLDPTIEIAYIPKTGVGAYPGVYLFTQAGRMIRPVTHLETGAVEWIGPMEQVYMEIACLVGDVRSDTTHIEVDPAAMLSQIASLTPYSDYNQSPRNMYQCQMGKQTMGTPAHALKYRADNKLYRIQNIQAPVVQTVTHRDYHMDEYPQGVNAVVAVISYTGYDMEDAMIINKAAFERGFGHGSVYKTSVIDLDEEEKRFSSPTKKTAFRFTNVKCPPLANSVYSDMIGEKFCDSLDYDGLPFEGVAVCYGEPLCCLVDCVTGEHRLINHKDQESAFVETVRIIGNTDSASSGLFKTKKNGVLRKISITLRYRRNPVIGDKFSSRHGQKGTLSVLWPQENMPFSESGFCPDVLINPHAFPSRMTIGMILMPIVS